MSVFEKKPDSILLLKQFLNIMKIQELLKDCLLHGRKFLLSFIKEEYKKVQK
jgi:hypothetical protein